MRKASRVAWFFFGVHIIKFQYIYLYLKGKSELLKTVLDGFCEQA